MTTHRALAVALAAIAMLAVALPARGDLTKQQAEKIRAAAPSEVRVTPKKPRRVLIWNTPFMEQSPHKGYTIPQAEYAMRTLGEKTGAFEPVVSDDVAMFLPENLKRFDAIGGGIVAYHHAIAGNKDWAEFQELLGASFWGHPWNEEVGIKLEEPQHPLLAAFGGKDFRLVEEVFQFRDPYSREKLRVLMSLDTEATNMSVPWIHRTDNDFALAWVKRVGEGRVFYCAIGHRTEHWWNPTILEFYLDAIQFAAGDLEAPADPR